MRPDGTPHLYETPMVPNLLPFSAAVTTGRGPTPTLGGTPLADTGFAAMVAPETFPTMQEPLGKGGAVLPLTAPRLLGLNDGVGAAPVDVALPELVEISDPLAVPVVPVVPVVVAAPVAPQPMPAAATDGDTPALPAAPIVKATEPAPAPEGGSVTVTDGPDKAVLSVLPPAFDAESGTQAPQAPAPITKPAPAPAGVGGTVTTVDRPDKSALPQPPTLPDAPAVPVAKPVAPAPVAGPQGDSVTIVEPVKKSAIPTPTGPKTRALPEDGSVTVTDGPDKGVVAPIIEAPLETAPAATAPMTVPVTASPVAEAVAQSDVPAEPNQAQPQIPVIAAATAAPGAPVVVTAPAEAPAPPQTETEAPAAAAPVALRVVEPAPAEIASDAPADDGAFDTLVTAKSDAETDALKTTSDTGGDAMNRDGNRQSAPQPAAPAPAAAQAAATPLPAFDPLAAAAPQGAAHAGDPAGTEHRARASAIGEDVGIAIVRHADSGSGDVLVIRLDPAELGKIEVRLRMDEARQLSAEVTADQPATLDLLRRDSDNLTRALNDAGFRADDQSLRFDSRSFGQSDQQAQQGRRIASRAYLNDGDAANAQSTPTPVQVRSSGRVDLVA
ncbi:flagellar hook-length control protein FliK [Sphingomonas sp.]